MLLCGTPQTIRNKIMAQAKIKLEYEGGLISLVDLAKAMDMHYMTIYTWYLKGTVTYKDMKERIDTHRRKKGLREKALKVIEAIKKPLPFDRTTHCFSSDHSMKCKHYDSCSDYRIFQSGQHKRFKEDGSCYDGEPIRDWSKQLC